MVEFTIQLISERVNFWMMRNFYGDYIGLVIKSLQIHASA